jgi:peptide/nickel transport system ATP-binding protein
MSPDELREVRGGLISYVPQDSSASLNPALRIGTQLREILEAHGFGSSPAEREARLKEMMAEVLLPADESFLQRYPHQLSGGQQQRVAIAMAFANRPRVIVLDEPTTALDVTTQAHVLQTIRELTKSYGVAALYVTHDLAVVANLADRIAVMYAGRIVEAGPIRDVIRTPRHPYTIGLLSTRAAGGRLTGKRLPAIPGSPPDLANLPLGCAFAPRCTFASDLCRTSPPEPVTLAAGHFARCYRTEETGGWAGAGERAG